MPPIGATHDGVFEAGENVVHGTLHHKALGDLDLVSLPENARLHHAPTLAEVIEVVDVDAVLDEGGPLRPDPVVRSIGPEEHAVGGELVSEGGDVAECGTVLIGVVG